MQDELKRRCDTIEETYEFMLAYAAQGLDGDSGSKSGGQLRGYLEKTDQALTGLGDIFRRLIEDQAATPVEPYQAFVGVLDEDAKKAQAGVRLVLAQSSISSQLIDNLNASIHVRALLTDLFLLDEVLKRRAQETASAPSA